MSSIAVETLTEEHLDAAARLLAARHARERAAEPLLPSIADYRGQVERDLHREGAAGAVGARGNDVVAYLIARPEGEDRVHVDLAGCAAQEPEALRDVYAALASEWVAAGRHRHSVMVPASASDFIDPWFRLAFGCQFVLAVRETADEAPMDFGGAIRPGRPEDLPAVAAFDKLLWDLQAGSPSFSGLQVPDLPEFELEWRDLWDDPSTYTPFVAERDGQIVGHAVVYRRPPGDLRVPEDGNIDLAHAATRPEVRGTGVGLALTAHVLAWARANGFASMTTDWRSVNLLSSRFWPRRGFRPTHVRMYRAVP